MSAPPSSKIVIEDADTKEDKTIEIEIENDMTYEQLLGVVLHKENLKEYKYSFHRTGGSDNTSEALPLEDKVRPHAEIGPIRLRTVPFDVKVRHMGLECNVQIEPADTSSDVLKKFEAEANEMVDHSVSLSFEGVRIDEISSMEEMEVIKACMTKLNSEVKEEEKEVTLYGALKVWIEDEKAGLNTSIEIYPFESIDDVIRKYCSAESRNFVTGSGLFVGEEELQSFQTVYEIKPPIEDEASLAYRAAKYEVEIKDSAVENELDAEKKTSLMQEVEDHWTVLKLREEYSKRPDARLVNENDIFFLNETALNRDAQLYRLGLDEGAVLHLRRAEVETFNLYICADCGEELKLKPQDAVRCKSCFYRIVYKKRTPKICQYNCR